MLLASSSFPLRCFLLSPSLLLLVFAVRKMERNLVGVKQRQICRSDRSLALLSDTFFKLLLV